MDTSGSKHKVRTSPGGVWVWGLLGFSKDLKLQASKPKCLRRGRALCEAAGHDEDHGLGFTA